MTKVDYDMSLTVGRPLKTSPEDTVRYELDMLRFAWSEINLASRAATPEVQMHMRLECFLLHYRNLVAFLAVPPRRADDLSLTKGFDKQLGADLRVQLEQIAEPLKGYANQISKYLAHLTTLRHTTPNDWQKNQMYFELLPAIDLLRKAFGFEPWIDGRPSSEPVEMNIAAGGRMPNVHELSS